MTTCATHACAACSITMELRGYGKTDISCPQCTDLMNCLGVDYPRGHRAHRHRSLRIYQPFTASLPKPMTKDEIEALVQELTADRLRSLEADRTTRNDDLKVLKEQAKIDRANTAQQLAAIDNTAQHLAAIDKAAEMNTLRARLDSARREISAIDKTATKARLTAESLRQSVIDQQKVVNDSKNDVDSLIKSRAMQRSSINSLVETTDSLTKDIKSLGSVQADLAMAVGDNDGDDDPMAITERLGTAETRLHHLKETLRKLEMSYVEEGSTQVAAAATDTTPALAEVAKTVGGAIGTGIALGASAQFISEVTELAVSKALKAGMITPALGESIVFKEALKLCIPILMLAASQYPACPKREFFGKVGDLAVRGQSAQHAAMATAFAMSFVSDMMALPSASGLGDQLSAAQ